MMGWPKGKKRVEQGNAVSEEPVADEPVQMAAPADWEGFLDWAQRRGISEGCVLVSLSHPDAPNQSHWDGIFSGFALSVGPACAKWSDGSTFSA